MNECCYFFPAYHHCGYNGIRGSGTEHWIERHLNRPLLKRRVRQEYKSLACRAILLGVRMFFFFFRENVAKSFVLKIQVPGALTFAGKVHGVTPEKSTHNWS